MSKKRRRHSYPTHHATMPLTDGRCLDMWGYRRPDGEYWVADLDRPRISLWAMFLPVGYLSLAEDWGLGKLAMGILKSLASKAAGISGQLGKPDPASKKKYPALVELLCDPVGPDSDPRELSTLTIKWQQGAFVIGVHEPNLSMSLWATGETLEGTLECLERRLNADDADWRRWSDKQEKIGRKKRS